MILRQLTRRGASRGFAGGVCTIVAFGRTNAGGTWRRHGERSAFVIWPVYRGDVTLAAHVLIGCIPSPSDL